MNHLPFRRLLAVGPALVSLVLTAAETPAKAPDKPPAPPAAAAPAALPATAAASEVFELPKVEVTARRIRELDRMIRRLEKSIAREKKRMKAGELDRALNNAKLAEAAAIFGGNSTDHLAAVAASRVRLMETERDLLTDMKQPRSLEELAMLEKELEKIRAMQRELDQVRR
ncbi:MAG: hypothetical protein JNG83_07930 [Opitutaceae bacterium]|nr:hypothetical protein [Opitutaceae bacterium]